MHSAEEGHENRFLAASAVSRRVRKSLTQAAGCALQYWHQFTASLPHTTSPAPGEHFCLFMRAVGDERLPVRSWAGSAPRKSRRQATAQMQMADVAPVLALRACRGRCRRERNDNLWARARTRRVPGFRAPPHGASATSPQRQFLPSGLQGRGSLGVLLGAGAGGSSVLLCGGHPGRRAGRAEPKGLPARRGNVRCNAGPRQRAQRRRCILAVRLRAAQPSSSGALAFLGNVGLRTASHRRHSAEPVGMLAACGWRPRRGRGVRAR